MPETDANSYRDVIFASWTSDMLPDQWMLLSSGLCFYFCRWRVLQCDYPGSFSSSFRHRMPPIIISLSRWPLGTAWFNSDLLWVTTRRLSVRKCFFCLFGFFFSDRKYRIQNSTVDMILKLCESGMYKPCPTIKLLPTKAATCKTKMATANWIFSTILREQSFHLLLSQNVLA